MAAASSVYYVYYVKPIHYTSIFRERFIERERERGDSLYIVRNKRIKRKKPRINNLRYVKST